MTTDAKRFAAEKFCDQCIDFSVQTMLKTEDVNFEIVMDRLLTFCAAHICMQGGSLWAAEQFRDIADKIDAGVFHRITGEGRGGATDH